MIKNIIFDMGGVLIDYNPEKALYSIFAKETADLLLKEIFRNPVWSDKDRGIIFPDDIMAMKKDVIPADIYNKVYGMVENFYPYMPPFEKMYDFIKQLKDNGYGIYLLSNASSDFHERRSGIPALSLFDGVIISADYKLLKPEKEIYEALYSEFSLRPEECFFIDDVQANIDGARATGMDGHCYYHGDIEILKTALIEKGIKI
ncbi:MAG: HAD family phosphatase [Acutalibacteraceae bacterium]|nr:HAD family phosphatase [Acutalibacteraceae bacterium]